ncbi:MAG: histidine--tRNA ligase [candidate division WOR-3 bacterium]|nr:histidine--tRNA ligase [candidate division WOR-3 bacterium]MDH7519426.1 histidine--tRNA ligase [bacterium]
MLKSNRPKGTQDFVPPQSEKKFWAEKTFRRLAHLYGYREIVTPTFEHTEVFIKSSGSTSDIVQKEMYTFNDRAGRSLTLKPEGTPGVVRAVLENQLRLPCRLFYITPCFRYSRPQKGRYREFYQLGAEALGEAHPLVDAETIQLGAEFFARLGINDCLVLINSIGCRLCRPHYREKLLNFLRPYQEELCPDCASRLEHNPLRTFDCKNPHCQKVLEAAPLPHQHLCPECQKHFAAVLSGLKNTPVRWELNEHLVRGLDYYNRTTFEFVSPVLGEQISLGGGGRYDYLIEEFGGPPTPAIGLAIGLERTLLALPEPETAPLRQMVFIVWTGAEELPAARELVDRLRAENIPALISYETPKLKRQFHLADLAQARLCVVVGAEEMKRGVYGLKDLSSGAQTEVSHADIVNRIREILNS